VPSTNIGSAEKEPHSPSGVLDQQHEDCIILPEPYSDCLTDLDEQRLPYNWKYYLTMSRNGRPHSGMRPIGLMKVSFKTAGIRFHFVGKMVWKNEPLSAEETDDFSSGETFEHVDEEWGISPCTLVCVVHDEEEEIHLNESAHIFFGKREMGTPCEERYGILFGCLIPNEGQDYWFAEDLS